MDENLVTVAQFSDAMEAHMARGLLESEGIPTAVENEGPRQYLGILDNGASVVLNVRLKVRAVDAERAAEVLRRVEEPEEP